ncbi:MAG: oligogalacturonate lyase family protein [Gemmiger sp.]|nr:oligogalacturonate lyase family protein [Gemmiger sp.]
MSIGTILHNHATTYLDPYTGHEVTRLTEPDHTCHHMYFYNRMTTADGKKLLYCAELNGERQLYLMDLDTGDALQLTEGPSLEDYGGLITADDKAVIYQQGNALWKVDVATLARTCLYRAADGWNCGNWGTSEDNHFLVLAETRRDTLPDLTGKKGWEFFPIVCAAKPLCHIVYLDTLTGKSHVVVVDHCWFGHAQLRPHDPDTILFCHEGPYDMIDARLWLVQSDGSNYRCARQQPSDLIITHEFWMPDGHQFAYVRRETTGAQEEAICLMNPATLKEETLMPCQPYAHFICDPQMQYFAGDCQGSDTPIHLQGQQGDSQAVRNNFIYLVDIATRKEIPLCWHGTSWTAAHGSPQDAHPHPCFTGDGKRLLFTSDKDGKPAIYQVKL